MKAIVFDLFNTLVHSPGFAEVTEILFPGVPHPNISALVSSHYTGSSEETLRKIAKVFGVEMSNAAIAEAVVMCDEWAVARRFYPTTRETLVELRKRGFQLAVLSNTNELLEKTVEANELSQYFDHIALSHRIGCTKPNRAAFQWVLEKLGIEPQDAIMVGDNLVYDVEGAKAAGMKAVQITRAWQPQGPEKIRLMRDLLSFPELQVPS